MVSPEGAEAGWGLGGQGLSNQWAEIAQRYYPWHRNFFVAFNVILTAVNIYAGPPWWALWPLVITGGLFLLHFLVYKTSMVDEAWVEERAAEVYDRSYEQSHIEVIAERSGLETPDERRRAQRKARPRRTGEEN